MIDRMIPFAIQPLQSLSQFTRFKHMTVVSLAICWSTRIRNNAIWRFGTLRRADCYDHYNTAADLVPLLQMDLALRSKKPQQSIENNSKISDEYLSPKRIWRNFFQIQALAK